MLIRWMEAADATAWIRLADEVAALFNSPGMARDPVFLSFVEKRIRQREALGAFDRMTGLCLGVIGFSRKSNQIAWLAVSRPSRGRGAGTRLLQCAIRQLDETREIPVVTFRPGDPEGLPARILYLTQGFVETEAEYVDSGGNLRCRMVRPPGDGKRGASFHYDYPGYEAWSDPASCPVCQGRESPDPPVELAALANSRVECYEAAQGRLFGKCHVLARVHGLHFSELPPGDMAAFMRDVQLAGAALLRVTGAVRINYEIHANSMPHLHAHLFPRYLDDGFPSAPIDYRIVGPSPYEPGEFDWFVARMREELAASVPGRTGA